MRWSSSSSCFFIFMSIMMYMTPYHHPVSGHGETVDEIQDQIDQRIHAMPRGPMTDSIHASRDLVSTLSLKPCRALASYTDPDLGTVTLDPLMYCDPRTFRFFLGLTCCAPQPPTHHFPRFYLYTPTSDLKRNGTLLNWRDESAKKHLGEGPVLYLIHGWSETYDTSIWLRGAVYGWTRIRKRNVIVVDWSGDEANKYYFQTAANVRTVGKAVGFSILKWGLADRVSVVGMSCGAQVVGEAGLYVRQRGQLIADCVGLDPAGPCFDGGHDDIRLTADDCRLVQIVHSSAESSPTSTGIFDRKFGTYYKSGQCDFWINCGKEQGEECTDPKFGKIVGHDGSVSLATKDHDWCGHHRAALAYVSQVNRTCSLVGEKCTDCQVTNQDPKECSSSRTWGEKALVPDSICSISEESDFNVKTTDYYPYCD